MRWPSASPRRRSRSWIDSTPCVRDRKPNLSRRRTRGRKQAEGLPIEALDDTKAMRTQGGGSPPLQTVDICDVPFSLPFSEDRDHGRLSSCLPVEHDFHLVPEARRHVAVML